MIRPALTIGTIVVVCFLTVKSTVTSLILYVLDWWYSTLGRAASTVIPTGTVYSTTVACPPHATATYMWVIENGTPQVINCTVRVITRGPA
jgi:hypothetical protein